MTESTMVARYDAAATLWGSQIGELGYLQAYRAFIKRAAPSVGAHTRVCDIGTGAGSFALAASSIVPRLRTVALVDPSAAMLAQAHRALGRTSPATSCHQTTLQGFTPNAQYDLVLAAHVIEHCPDPVAALDKLHSLLAPGGQLLMVISRPHWCQWLIWIRWRHRWYAPSELDQMADRVGLARPDCYRFHHGPPSRTSLGYSFTKPSKDT